MLCCFSHFRRLKLKRLSFVIPQMMNISSWTMKQKSPKLHQTVGKKDRYPPFWCFFESNFMLMICPLFCKYSNGVQITFTEIHSLKSFYYIFFSCFLGTDWLAISTTYSCGGISWKTGSTVMRRQACFWLLLLCRRSLVITCQRYRGHK